MENRNPGKTRSVFLLAVGAGALVLLMLYMGGAFTTGRIQPGKSTAPPGEKATPRNTARASLETVTEHYTAVGTVRPKMETRVESQILARIHEVRVRPGDRVAKGQELVVLDSRELLTRVEQADQGLASARSRHGQMEQARIAAMAEFTRAEAAFRRTKTYFDSKAATSQDMEQAEAAHRQAGARLEQAAKALSEADAGVKQAAKSVEQAGIALGYTRILAPEPGEVAKRLAEPGDLAAPGKPLLLLQTRGKLRLEALVPEGLIPRLREASSLDVRIDAVGKTLIVGVQEVIPSADPATRSFLVKADLPDDPDIYPGMFGRLLIPVQELKVVLIPKRALRKVGQLEMVTAELEGRWQRIYVKTGRVMGDRVEVLSGLKGGEKLALEGAGNV